MNGSMQGAGTVAAMGSALLFAALAASPAAYAGDAGASPALPRSHSTCASSSAALASRTDQRPSASLPPN